MVVGVQRFHYLLCLLQQDYIAYHNASLLTIAVTVSCFANTKICDYNPAIGTNFCDYNCDFYKKLSLGHISLQKRREAWRLTVLSSAMPSDGDGEAGFTDTIRPHAD